MNYNTTVAFDGKECNYFPTACNSNKNDFTNVPRCWHCPFLRHPNYGINGLVLSGLCIPSLPFILTEDIKYKIML